MKNRMENGAETLDLGWHKDGNVVIGAYYSKFYPEHIGEMFALFGLIITVKFGSGLTVEGSQANMEPIPCPGPSQKPNPKPLIPKP